MIEDISYGLYISKENTNRREVNKVTEQNSFRRMLAQHCIFGIDKDLNAVWLTKLSLWLHTAEKGKPFVFLDHHITQGDSILSTVEIPTLPATELAQINKVMKEMAKQHSEDRAAVVNSASLWAKLKALTKRHVKLQNPQLSLFDTHKEIRETYFSYAMAFPEVFLNSSEPQRGFNIIVGNPPWDTVKPKLPDFYKMETGADKAPARKDLDKWVEATTARQKKFDNYRDNSIKYAAAIKGSGYKLQAGEVYTYAYFTERSLQTLCANGLMCYIVKLGLYGDEKIKKLRQHLFSENFMEKMWVVKKNKTSTGKFFSQIDPNEKFLIFVNRKIGLKNPKQVLDYQVLAKEIHEFSDVNHKFEKWQSYDVAKSLDSLSKITVYDSEERSTISSKLREFSTVKSAGLEVGRELDITLDRKVFAESKTKTPIFSGTELSNFGMKPAIQWCKDEKKFAEIATSTQVRLAINDILPNSRRKIKCSEVPSGSLVDNSLLIVYGFKSELDKYLVMASLNSLLVDYYLRPNLSNIHLNNFRLYDLPVPFEIPTLAKQEIQLQVKALSKSKNFTEDIEAYKKVEAILAVCYGLLDSEIRGYIKTFGGLDISTDVVDYAQIYRKDFGLTKPAASKASKPERSIRAVVR